MTKRLQADVRRALERAATRAAGLSADEFDDAVRHVMETLARGISGKLAKRDKRIADALAELIPLLDEMRDIARNSRSDDRASALRKLTQPLERWRARYGATDSARQIEAWLIDGDREPHQKGPKKRAAGVAFKVTSRLPWANSIAPATVERIYRNLKPPLRERWWRVRLSETPDASKRGTPLSIVGARRKPRTR